MYFLQVSSLLVLSDGHCKSAVTNAVLQFVFSYVMAVTAGGFDFCIHAKRNTQVIECFVSVAHSCLVVCMVVYFGCLSEACWDLDIYR